MKVWHGYVHWVGTTWFLLFMLWSNFIVYLLHGKPEFGCLKILWKNLEHYYLALTFLHVEYAWNTGSLRGIICVGWFDCVECWTLSWRGIHWHYAFSLWMHSLVILILNFILNCDHDGKLLGFWLLYVIPIKFSVWVNLNIENLYHVFVCYN